MISFFSKQLPNVSVLITKQSQQHAIDCYNCVIQARRFATNFSLLNCQEPTRRCLPAFVSSKIHLSANRTIHLQNNLCQKSPDADSKADNNSSDPKSGWMDRIFPKRIETGTQPHSRLLSASDFIYEMHYHDAKPEYADKYIDKYESYCQELTDKSSNKAELVGSFRVEIGNQDQFIHIWRYHDGYKQASNIHQVIRTDSSLTKLNRELASNLNKRESQFMTSFSFWKHPQPQNLNSFYEMRSYLLKPGTMIDWANGWSKGLTHRDNSVAGFFSQIGQLYTVHHIWRYEDLQVRKHVREDAWRKPGWDECVSITVPNIVNLQTRWMVPCKFSPIC